MAARNPFASSDLFDDPYGLVQSSRPARHSTGYYFIRNLLFVGAVAGGVVAAYRNDVFRDLARHAGLEQRYLDAEKFLVGTPGWGTPRSMEPVLNPGEATADAHAADAHTAATTDTSAPATTAALTATAAATEPPVAVTAQAPAAPAHVAALANFHAVPALTQAPATHSAAAEPPLHRTATPAPVAHAAPAPVAHASAPRPAPVDHTHVKAIKVSLEEDAPAEPATRHTAPTHAAPPPEAPPPVATKPQKPEKPQPKATDAHDGDNPLLAAVRGAVRSRPPKGE
jgi:hypothetical protein